jgi:hypothetical protein
MNDEHTVVPETAGKMTDFEIEIDGEWICVNHEMKAHEIPMACPTCGGIDEESVLYNLDNGQYLYKSMCCLQFNVCIASYDRN